MMSNEEQLIAVGFMMGFAFGVIIMIVFKI
jgi:hypothetical protein